MLTPEQITTIIITLITGGVVGKVIDYVFAGFKDARRARGKSGDCTEYELQAAFWAEQLQITREKALTAGMSVADLGPIPKFVMPKEVKDD